MPKNYLHFYRDMPLGAQCLLYNLAIFVVLFLKWLCLVWSPGFSVRDLNWLPTGVDELATFMTSDDLRLFRSPQPQFYVFYSKSTFSYLFILDSRASGLFVLFKKHRVMCVLTYFEHNWPLHIVTLDPISPGYFRANGAPWRDKYTDCRMVVPFLSVKPM